LQHREAKGHRAAPERRHERAQGPGELLPPPVYGEERARAVEMARKRYREGGAGLARIMGNVPDPVGVLVEESQDGLALGSCGERPHPVDEVRATLGEFREVVFQAGKRASAPQQGFF